jgi:hypothetical protein
VGWWCARAGSIHPLKIERDSFEVLLDAASPAYAASRVTHPQWWVARRTTVSGESVARLIGCPRLSGILKFRVFPNSATSVLIFVDIIHALKIRVVELQATEASLAWRVN